MLHEHGAGSGAAEKIAGRDDKFYTIDVSGVPALVAYQGVEAMQADVYRTARLFGRKNREIKPESAYVTLRGLNVEITVRFPKTEPITLNDRQVKFWMESGPLEIFRTFKTNDMVYKGKLEL